MLRRTHLIPRINTFNSHFLHAHYIIIEHTILIIKPEMIITLTQVNISKGNQTILHTASEMGISKLVSNKRLVTLTFYD